jgi:serine protease
VTGTGPYAWSCTGSNGAASASCQANRTPTVAQPTVVTNTIGTLARGVSRYFTFTVPAGTRSVAFVLTGTAGDGDLFVSLGSQRPRTSATWRSTSWSPNDQVTLTQPSAGTYYVEVYGYANTTGVVLRTTITPQ